MPSASTAKARPRRLAPPPRRLRVPVPHLPALPDGSDAGDLLWADADRAVGLGTAYLPEMPDARARMARLALTRRSIQDQPA